MPTLTTIFRTCIVTTCLAVPAWASAAPRASVACTVAVDYVLNGAVTEEYRKDFVVTAGAAFVDDFSTPTRAKTFTATVAREAGKLAVAIDYFNDVGVFVAIGIDTKLTLHQRGTVETTSGSHTFSSSQAVPAGNHTTNYTLMCRRN